MTNIASRLATAIGALAIAAAASTAAFAGDGADLRAQQRNAAPALQAPVSTGGATAASGGTDAASDYQFHEARR